MGEIRQISNEVILQGRRNNQAWFCPSLAVVPPNNNSGLPEVHIAVIQLIANDFGPIHYVRTYDLGKTWTPPMESLNLTGIPHEDDVFEKPLLWPRYHKATGKLIALGATSFTRDQGGDPDRKNEGPVAGMRGDMAWAVWDRKTNDFQPWHRSSLPRAADRRFDVCFYCSQWHECEDGTVIMPLVTPETDKNRPTKVGSFRMSFDGARFAIKEIGSSFVGLDKFAGVHEPSLIQFGGRYYMTLRSEYGDFRMYRATSDDGLEWKDFGPWCWDDGTEVETENTQQHWLKRKDSLYLVYTRKSELSNGVFRSRAPLFIAEVDVERFQLIRESERIVFPEQGARMGNFNVANVTENEAWVVTGEWLQQMDPRYRKGMRFWAEGAPKYNRIQYIGDLLLARIHFA